MIDKMPSSLKKYYFFFGGLGIFVLVIISYGFYLVGTPSEQRNQRLDAEKEQYLGNLAYYISDRYGGNSIVNNVSRNMTLPDKIEDVIADLNFTYNDMTLENFKKYEIKYIRTGNSSYKLCTDFLTSSYQVCFENGMKKDCEKPESNQLTYVDTSPYTTSFGNHKAGYQCREYLIKRQQLIDVVNEFPVVNNIVPPVNNGLPMDAELVAPDGPESVVIRPVRTIPVCGLETCHGIENIRCGSNVPEVCDASYQAGDRCREYVHCGDIAGKCTLSINTVEYDVCSRCLVECERKNAIIRGKSARSEVTEPLIDVSACLESCLGNGLDSL